MYIELRFDGVNRLTTTRNAVIVLGVTGEASDSRDNLFTPLNQCR